MAAVLLLAGAAAPREALGQFAGWGAFREAGHCFAMARGPGRGSDLPTLMIASWPARRLYNQVHVHLGLAGAARVTLAVGDRRFALVVRGSDAWAPDARIDRRIVAALRTGSAAVVRAEGPRGHRYVYLLEGAASAIDAAAVACLSPD